MPEYRPETRNRKAKELAILYKKSKGKQAEMARQAGVSRAAISQRFKRNPEISLLVNEQIQEEAKKQGVNIRWYLMKLKNGAEKASKVTGYLNKKVNGLEQVSDEFVETPDWNSQHRYLVTLGEFLGYLKQNSSDTNVTTQVLVGAELMDRIKELENTRIKSEAKNE